MTESAAYWNQLNPTKPTVSDNLLILLGAFAQQGTETIINNINIDLDSRILLKILKILLKFLKLNLIFF